jgi:hypothetical protein
MKPLIDTAVVNEIIVRADFANPAAIEHHNLVGSPDRRQPVRDYDNSAVFNQIIQRALYQHL